MKNLNAVLLWAAISLLIPQSATAESPASPDHSQDQKFALSGVAVQMGELTLEVPSGFEATHFGLDPDYDYPVIVLRFLPPGLFEDVSAITIYRSLGHHGWNKSAVIHKGLDEQITLPNGWHAELIDGSPHTELQVCRIFNSEYLISVVGRNPTHAVKNLIKLESTSKD